jgi:hypothetical protein
VGAEHDLTFTGIFFQSRYRSKSSEFGSFVTSQSLAVDPSQSKFDANGALISSPAVFQRDSSTFLPQRRRSPPAAQVLGTAAPRPRTYPVR